MAGYTRTVYEIETREFLFARVDDVAGVNVIIITSLVEDASQAFVYDDILIGDDGYFSPADLAWSECEQFARDEAENDG